jgi:hypothetical protein
LQAAHQDPTVVTIGRLPIALRRQDKTTLARRAFGGTVHALCKRRRTMACTITSLFLIAMF